MAQYQKNIANAKSQLSQGEIQLETMTNMLSRLRDLTQTAATGSLSEDDRRAVSSELAIIKDGLLDLANARNDVAMVDEVAGLVTTVAQGWNEITNAPATAGA